MADEQKVQRVVVVDSESRRAEKMRAAFGQTTCVVDVITIKIATDDTALVSRLTDDPRISLVLRHFGDQKVAGGVRGKLTVYYGGNGGFDTRYDSQDAKAIRHERILRPIQPDGSGALVHGEAVQLLRYLLDSETGQDESERETIPKPPFFVGGKAYAILPALLILCIGYDVVNGGNSLKNVQLLSGARLDSYTRRREQVRDPKWWKVLLGNKVHLQNELAMLQTAGIGSETLKPITELQQAVEKSETILLERVVPVLKLLDQVATLIC